MNESITRIAQWGLWSFSLGWRSGGQREGVIVGLQTASGTMHFGEASPHPDVHRRTADQVAAELIEWLKQPGLLNDLSPAARFGVESALAPGSGTVTVRLNGLARTADQALALAEEGYETIKLKVGTDPEADAHWVQGVREALPDVHLRLDANRRYSKAEALSFCRAVVDLDIEYIEEPTQASADLPDLRAATGIRIALDESTREPGLEALLAHADAVILKPSALGHEGSKRLAEEARTLGLTAVFSSCFESGVGITAIGQLAAQSGSPGVAVGLGTGAALVGDLLAQTPTPKGGQLMLRGATKEEDLNWDFLTPIATS